MARRCLLVSNDSALRMKLSVALRREGFEVLAAKTPLEALLYFGSTSVNAVLCDLQELAADPSATVRTLRGNDSHRTPLVITLGDAPVEPLLARHIDRTTPAAFVAARLSSMLDAVRGGQETTAAR